MKPDCCSLQGVTSVGECPGGGACLMGMPCRFKKSKVIGGSKTSGRKTKRNPTNKAFYPNKRKKKK